jgi:hypothetical protein
LNTINFFPVLITHRPGNAADAAAGVTDAIWGQPIIATPCREGETKGSAASHRLACYPAALDTLEFKTEGQLNNQVIWPRGGDW